MLENNLKMLLTSKNTILNARRGYLYGFNGQEKDNSIKGQGNSYNFGARMLDVRLGRWFAVDPLVYKYSYISSYNFAHNKPLLFTDDDGKEISYSLSSDKNGKPIVKITIVAKVIDLSTNLFVDANSIATNLNEYGNEWLNDSDEGTKISGFGFNFGTEENPIYYDEVTVQFDFQFEAVESIQEINESDHLLVLTDFNSDQIANGIMGHGGKVATVDIDVFQGPVDRITGIGSNIALHEFVTHGFGLSHTRGDKSRLTYGNGVKWYSDIVTRAEKVRALTNLLNGSLNKGATLMPADNSGNKMPNTTVTTEKGETLNISTAGADTDVIKEKSIENQDKDIEKSEVKKFQSDPNDQEE